MDENLWSALNGCCAEFSFLRVERPWLGLRALMHELQDFRQHHRYDQPQAAANATVAVAAVNATVAATAANMTVAATVANTILAASGANTTMAG
jgi:hypothetical protein